MRGISFSLLLVASLMTVFCGHAMSQDTAPAGPTDIREEVSPPEPPELDLPAPAPGDPTVPSEAILRRIPRSTSPTAQDLLESAKRLHDAGLILKARERMDQLQELENAPLDIQDEAAAWWASVAPEEANVEETPESIQMKKARDVLDSAKRLQEAGLTLQARARLDELQELDNAPLDIQDEAAVWWASVAPETPVVTAPAGPTRSGQPQVAVALAKLPAIILKGVVLSSPESGTAMLEIDNRQISIPLKPREQQKRVPVPASQFASVQATLAQRTRLADGSPGKADGYEMCLQCSFVHNSIIFNLEAFDSETLLLQALPHNQFIIVRAGPTP